MCPTQLRGCNYALQIMTNQAPCSVESSRQSQMRRTTISARDRGPNVGCVRDLRSNAERENAAVCVLVDNNTPSMPVRTEASAAGPTAAAAPRLKELSPADLIAGKHPVPALPIQVVHDASVGVEPEAA